MVDVHMGGLRIDLQRGEASIDEHRCEEHRYSKGWALHISRVSIPSKGVNRGEPRRAQG